VRGADAREASRIDASAGIQPRTLNLSPQRYADPTDWVSFSSEPPRDSPAMAQHDSSYKLLFSHRKMVADLIRAFVHEDWAAGLDLDTLQRVRESGITQDLREREDDVIWRLRIVKDGRECWLYLYLILEFQSTVDRAMAVRLLTYVGLLYEDLLKSGEIGPGDPLPPVLPVVIYNGSDPWTAKTDLADMLDPSLPPQLRHWQPQMRYLLLEERRYREADLEGLPNAAAALFRLEDARAPENIQRVVGCLIEWLAGPENAGLRRAFVVWLKRVLLPARLPGIEIPNLNELQEINDMLAERVMTWTEQWKQQGVKEGVKQGVQEGETKLLRRLLVRRFGSLPSWVEQRLEQAGEAELEAWADRVLECGSLEEVFGGVG